MTNYEFLKKYQKLQEGVMFDGLVDFDFISIGWSNTDKSSFWNLALVNKPLKDEEIKQAEEFFVRQKRNPAFYFENRDDLEILTNTLERGGYAQDFKDSWQFWKGGEISANYFDSVKKVTNKEELKIYLQTFNACYQKGDPQNPYGELGEYLKVAEEVWHKNNKTNRLEYFIIYKRNKPVAVSTLTNFEGIGYISNVGSLKEVRGEGFGKAATLYCVQQSIKNGNKDHCLATEEGAYPNEFYKRIGFETKFTAVGYTKRNLLSN
jgi:ribosomal protein S18 acetylase RimI-like enzyme